MEIGDLMHWGLPPDRYGRQRLLTVYLGGPIAGGTYERATMWRAHVAEHLNATAPHIRCLDPMRDKGELCAATSIAAGEGGSVYGPRLTVARDLWDVTSCDIVLLNLLDAPAPSIGSMVELGHAAALRKLVIVVLPADRPNPHDHPFVWEVASAVVHSLDEALRILQAA